MSCLLSRITKLTKTMKRVVRITGTLETGIKGETTEAFVDHGRFRWHERVHFIKTILYRVDVVCRDCNGAWCAGMR